MIYNTIAMFVSARYGGKCYEPRKLNCKLEEYFNNTLVNRKERTNSMKVLQG